MPAVYWCVCLCSVQLNDQSGCGLENEGMIVWFRVSAFPNFRKLYGRFLSPDGEGKVMNAGNYSVEIEYSILTLSVTVYIYIGSLCTCVTNHRY